MRAILIPVLLGIFGVSAHGMTSPESRVPEAVYYANAYADHYHLPRELVHAIIEQESGWNQRALSNKGAIGLMQLMPAIGCDLIVPESSIKPGLKKQSAIKILFGSDVRAFRGPLRVCIFATDRDLRMIHQHDRAAFDLVSELEEQSGFTMKTGRSLVQIVSQTLQVTREVD